MPNKVGKVFWGIIEGSVFQKEVVMCCLLKNVRVEGGHWLYVYLETAE